jgi:hypothetical protein
MNIDNLTPGKWTISIDGFNEADLVGTSSANFTVKPGKTEYVTIIMTRTWHVAGNGSDDTGDGTAARPFATVTKALGSIQYACNPTTIPTWSDGAAGVIVITGTITADAGTNGMIDISGENAYPPLVLRGTGTINASGKTTSVLYIADGNKVTLDGPTLTGGDSSIGGGVMLAGTDGNLSTFTMNGGAISGNEAVMGGGVSVSDYGTFTMNGGAISGNKATMGGGVSVSEYGTFIMNGGTIYGSGAPGANTVSEGGIYAALLVGGTAKYGDDTPITDLEGGGDGHSATGGTDATLYGRR